MRFLHCDYCYFVICVKSKDKIASHCFIRCHRLCGSLKFPSLSKPLFFVQPAQKKTPIFYTSRPCFSFTEVMFHVIIRVHQGRRSEPTTAQILQYSRYSKGFISIVLKNVKKQAQVPFQNLCHIFTSRKSRQGYRSAFRGSRPYPPGAVYVPRAP